MAKMDDKTFVRCNYPHAYDYKWPGSWVIYADKDGSAKGQDIGHGPTRSEAWRDARTRIVAKYKGPATHQPDPPRNEVILVDLSQFEDVARFVYSMTGFGNHEKLRASARKMLDMIEAQKKGAHLS